MLKKTLISLLILACLLVLPIVAQTPPAPAANETMGTNPAATHKVHRKTLHAAHHGGAFDDATRLAALLADTQDKATISPATWKIVANDALTLAGRLYLSRTPKTDKDVKEARKHVREMHDAALKGDADGARSHAALALPYVYKVIDATKG